jgi:hypothetical protein
MVSQHFCQVTRMGARISHDGPTQPFRARLSTSVPVGTVLNPLHITAENNEMIKAQPVREKAFARVSGGGNETGIYPLLPVKY